LAFGPIDPNDEETRGAEVGQMIQEELERVGLRVQWNGTFSQRILLPDITWQRW